MSVGENIVIRYLEKGTQSEVVAYFVTHHIKYFSAEFRVENQMDSCKTIYTEHFILNIPSDLVMSQIIREIGAFDSVLYASSQHNIA